MKIRQENVCGSESISRRYEYVCVAFEGLERVVFLGRLPYAEVAGVVAHAAVSFVPIAVAQGEMMHSPLKLYESMACGVPVIASDVLGVAEVVRECACGELVPPGDAKAVAQATAGLVNDPARAAEMGRRGRVAAVDRFSWVARSRQREDLVERAIEASGR